MTDSVESVERLKSIIIEHVAKDVLLLHGEVEKLNYQLKETKDIVKQINSDANGYFDNMAARVIELLKKQEEHLQVISEQRTTQVEMNISDRVAKILNKEFETYTGKVEKASEDFNEISENLTGKLKKEFEEFTGNFEKASKDLNEMSDDLNSRLEKANKAAIENLTGHYIEAKSAMQKMAEQQASKASGKKVALVAAVAACVNVAIVVPILAILIKIV